MPGKTPHRPFSEQMESCFNEAPAKCRGKRRPELASKSRMTCFNEAPAKCRGKQAKRMVNIEADQASMRPQRNAGENGALVEMSRRNSICFNEAPAKCRGKPY